jgi:hypothetical protein
VAEEKKKASVWVCVSDVGAVIPKKDGGSRVLKRGDILEGEYYEQVAPKVQGLVRKEDLDEKFLARLDKERRMRSGEAFPAEFKKAMAGVAEDFDPRFDKSPADAAATLGQVIQEESGGVHRSKGLPPVRSGKPPSA